MVTLPASRKLDSPARLEIFRQTLTAARGAAVKSISICCGTGCRAYGALAVGVLSNTGFKLGIALVIGRGDFRRIVSVGLIALALASFAALVWL